MGARLSSGFWRLANAPRQGSTGPTVSRRTPCWRRLPSAGGPDVWRPAGKPDKCRTRKEFFGKLQGELTRDELRRDPERVFCAVVQTLSQHVTNGEVEEVKQSLPSEIRELWPEPGLDG